MVASSATDALEVSGLGLMDLKRDGVRKYRERSKKTWWGSDREAALLLEALAVSARGRGQLLACLRTRKQKSALISHKVL